MAKFEVGKFYEWNDPGNGMIKVLKRTGKSIVVENNVHNTFRLAIKIDDRGDEFVIDSSVPERWREAFTCSARWEA